MKSIGVLLVFLALHAHTADAAASVHQKQKPLIVLNDRDAVLCGGIRAWVCHATGKEEFAMLPATTITPDTSDRQASAGLPEFKSNAHYELPSNFTLGTMSREGVAVPPEKDRIDQREVYLFVADLMKRNALSYVANVLNGRGSGIKLAEILRDHTPAGIVASDELRGSLKQLYPNGVAWLPVSGADVRADIVLVTDHAFEFERDPDELARYLMHGIRYQYLVIQYSPRATGSWSTETMFRQWSRAEFSRYLTGRGMKVDPHVHASRGKQARYYEWIVIIGNVTRTAADTNQQQQQQSYHMFDGAFTKVKED